MLWGAFSVPTAYAYDFITGINNTTDEPPNGIYSNLNQSTGLFYYQSLGTSLSGEANIVTLYAYASTSANIKVYIRKCDNNTANPTGAGCTNQTNSDSDSQFVSTKGFYTFDVGNFELENNKYYFVIVESVSGSVNLDLYGSTNSTYLSGTCTKYPALNTCGTIATLADLYFYLAGVNTNSARSSAYNLTPATGSTTASTYVNFSFKYDAWAVDSITSYKIYIKDAQTPSPTIADYILTGSATTGSGTSVSRYATLVSGHAYYWWVEICGTVCHTGGGTQQFSVVTPFYLNPNWANIAATSTSGSPFLNISTSTLSGVTELQCGALDILDGTCISSVFSYLFIPNPYILSQFGGLGDQLSTKIPFSYVYEIENAFNNITLNATSSMPIISIPLSDISSSTVTGVIPDLEISTTTISTYLPDSARTTLHTILIASLWLGFGWYVFRRALTIFSPNS